MHSYGPPHMAEQKQDDQLEHTHRSYAASHDDDVDKSLRILEGNIIRQKEMKEKFKKEYLRRTRKLLETKLHSRNLIKGINTWVVPVRFSLSFLKWTREELQQMNQRTRKLMTIYKVLHPRDDVDRLYVCNIFKMFRCTGNPENLTAFFSSGTKRLLTFWV